MKRLLLSGLLAAGIIAGWPPSSRAEQVTLGKIGIWEAFGGRDREGVRVCGLLGQNRDALKMVSIKFYEGGEGIVLQVTNADWSFQHGQTVAISVQFDDEEPHATMATTGEGNVAEVRLTYAGSLAFMREFKRAARLTISFPDDVDASLILSLSGSTQISRYFGSCLGIVAKAIQSEMEDGGE